MKGLAMHAPPKVVSAQVLIAPAGADRVEELRTAWCAAGFETGPALGGTFAITAPQRHFEQVFGTRLASDASGGVLASARRELPLTHLRRPLRHGVALITFGRPPDFGPGHS
jgi:hypothetical protein